MGGIVVAILAFFVILYYWSSKNKYADYLYNGINYVWMCNDTRG